MKMRLAHRPSLQASLGRRAGSMHRVLSSLLVAATMAVCGSSAVPASTLAGNTAIPASALDALGCGDTPFGRRVTLGEDAEMFEFVDTSDTLNVMGELQPAPASDPNHAFWRSYNSPLRQGDLAGTRFIRAVAVDFDGDGRDEIVTANRVIASGALRLGVFHRVEGENGPTAELFDTWTLDEPFGDVRFGAGDLDGSADGRQELAVLVIGNDIEHFSLLVLEGDASDGAGKGGIARGSNDWDGRYDWDWPGMSHLDMGVGDLLLDGHEQMAITGIDSHQAQHRNLLQILAEYQPTTPVLWHPPGGTIGRVYHSSPINNTFRVSEGSDEGVGINYIGRLDTLVGDVVGDPAAELVNILQFEQSNEYYIGMRLQHYVTTREKDPPYTITSIALAQRNPNDPATDFDSSILVQNGMPTGMDSYEATIANVDKLTPSEIVIARALDGQARLGVSVYKAVPDFQASFTYAFDAENELHATFTNTSTGGDEVVYEWDFGDGSPHSRFPSATHDYAHAGTYTVELKATEKAGTGESRVSQANVVTGTSTPDDGAVTSFSRLQAQPAWSGALPTDEVPTLVNVAVGDMDKNGVAEIMTEAKTATDKLHRASWWLDDFNDPESFTSHHETEVSPRFTAITAIDDVAADFDGDSSIASIGTDCRRVREPQLRQVVWMPPYFRHLQADSTREASFGRSTESQSETEQQSGSFTSHDISGYVGIGVGLDFLGAKVAARATAGYNYQSSHGSIRGTSNHFQTDAGSLQTQGEALVMVEKNSFDCYSYLVGSQAQGIDPLSALRMCEHIDGTRSLVGEDADDWDTVEPASTPGYPPAQWVPLQRDWNSLALFKPAVSNAQFQAGKGVDKATDGLFTTSTVSQGVMQQPYLQIDLGQVRDISNIRIFPTEDQSARLAGFRLYASTSPMTQDGLPIGPDVSVFQPDTEDGAVYDRWNVWTRQHEPPYAMLRARYIRLQSPQSAQLDIAEIQVFGDVHAEPPAYPDAICDPVIGDGYFNAWVWDAGTGVFRKIEQRGDLLWDGTYKSADIEQPPPDGDPCRNPGSFTTHASIWSDRYIGHNVSTSWSVGSAAGKLTGSTTSFESANRVGAEFDLETGLIATVTTGLSTELATGLTSDTQTTSYWGEGLDMGGAIGGFETPYKALIDACEYNPRPYAYHLVERSITGYRHDIYVVDYTVHQDGNGILGWRRGSVPVLCQHDDPIFANGFD